MSMQLTARPARRPLSMPLCGRDGSVVSGSIAGAVVDVVACAGPAADAEDALATRHNRSVARPATNSVRAPCR
jgi:hypothetical protein